jgi:hypothetical protein
LIIYPVNQVVKQEHINVESTIMADLNVDKFVIQC